MDQAPEYTEEELSKAKCEVKTKNIYADGGFEWMTKPVSNLKEPYQNKAELKRKGKPLEIRCPHCKGPIRLEFQGAKKGKHSKPDHFEHLGESAGASDRRTCRSGVDFPVGGVHQLSIKPVE
jgi:hypothetical protein